jgi:hypothetical protein
VIEHIVIALIIAIVVGLLCILVGKLLKAMSVPPAAAAGDFLETYAWAIGLVAGLWAFVTGWRP